MGTTVRSRFIALDLAEGWIELQRKGLWTLKHPARRGELRISMFPVAEGVAMDLATIVGRERHRRAVEAEMVRRLPKGSQFFSRSVFLDEDSWSEGSLYGLATSTRRDRPSGIQGPFAWPGLDPTTYTRNWTVCDGRYVLEGAFHEFDADHFRAGVEECNAMIRSVRFEGPS